MITTYTIDDLKPIIINIPLPIQLVMIKFLVLLLYFLHFLHFSLSSLNI